MTRKNVIESIENVLQLTHEKSITVTIPRLTAELAVFMLKDQEAVRPERQCSGGGTTWWNVCGNCRTAINPNDKFCHECGKRVKWND